jgi:hypothetical protein
MRFPMKRKMVLEQRLAELSDFEFREICARTGPPELGADDD